MEEIPTQPDCPACGSTDTEDAGYVPMDGHVAECNDCSHVFPTDLDGPEDDNWITAAYDRAPVVRRTRLGPIGRV